MQLKVCDPLYGYIYFDEEMRPIIEHRFFQRLRSIQQLGFSQYSFPSGVGNRFTHSLGVAHLADQAFEFIINNGLDISANKKQIFKKVLKMAALLHDIGHGPFSHSTECLMPKLDDLNINKYLNQETLSRRARHEDYSLKIIMESDLSQLLKNIGIEPRWVAQLLHKDFKGEASFFEENNLNYLPLLRQIISSELDVDRLDYLHRDSVSCGVRYGLIDYKWLLSHFDSYKKDNKVFLCVRTEAIYTIESFILGRRHMRMVVYFHHKSTIYNEMLKKYAQTCDWTLPTNIEQYCHFTDAYLLEKLKNDVDGKMEASTKNKTQKQDSKKWAHLIANQQPYVRLYEYSFIRSNHINLDDTNQTSDKKQKDQFKKEEKSFYALKKELEKQNISYIETNSKNHAIKPQKPSYLEDNYKGDAIKPQKPIPINDSIFLKNNLLNKVYSFFDEPSFTNLYNRQINRIYVEPSSLNPAENILKNLIKK